MRRFRIEIAHKFCKCPAPAERRSTENTSVLAHGCVAHEVVLNGLRHSNNSEAICDLLDKRFTVYLGGVSQLELRVTRDIHT